MDKVTMNILRLAAWQQVQSYEHAACGPSNAAWAKSGVECTRRALRKALADAHMPSLPQVMECRPRWQVTEFSALSAWREASEISAAVALEGAQ